MKTARVEHRVKGKRNARSCVSDRERKRERHIETYYLAEQIVIISQHALDQLQRERLVRKLEFQEMVS